MQLFVVCVLTGAVQVRENVEYMAELQVLPSSTFRYLPRVFCRFQSVTIVLLRRTKHNVYWATIQIASCS